MFTKVIVGVDEHQGGVDATALARELVGAGGSLLLVFVSVRDGLVGRSPGPNVESIEHKRVLERHAGAPGDTPTELRTVSSTSVGRALHELAGHERADLLVVGSCRRGLIGRVMIGDETIDALNGAPCAVAIAPLGYAHRPSVIGEIGVAYNGSPESEDALAVARGLAAEHGAKVSAFEAVSVPAFLALPGAGAVVESLPALVQASRDRITALGDVEPHAAYGRPSEELALYGASLDLMVIGSRGYGPAGRLVHGSTTRQLTRTARCPMLVITRGDRAARAAKRKHADPVDAVPAVAAG